MRRLFNSKLFWFVNWAVALFLLVFTIISIFEFNDAERLAYAAEKGDVETIDNLIRRNVNVDVRWFNKPPPLFRSFLAKNKDGYVVLLRHGADPNLIDGLGHSVINLGAEEKDPFWLREALKHGGNPNLINEGNPWHPMTTPIFYAISERRYDNVKLLIAAGANVNTKNGRGLSPLLQAEDCQAYDIALLLLESGADFREKNSIGVDLVSRLSLSDGNLFLAPEQEPWLLKVAEFVKGKGAKFEFAKKRGPPNFDIPKGPIP
jgi:uncharacterized protein